MLTHSEGDSRPPARPAQKVSSRSAVVHSTAVVLTTKGQFCHWACARRCGMIIFAFVFLIFLGAALVPVSPILATVVLTLGPSCIVLVFFYKRYECSTSRWQVLYTFCEAILLIFPLVFVAELVDQWNLRLTGRPLELACSWAPDKGGKALVYALSFSAHCPVFKFEKEGQWGELSCSSSYGTVWVPGLGNVSIPVTVWRDGSIPAPYLTILEKISVNLSGGTSCSGFADRLVDALDDVVVASIEQGQRCVFGTSKLALATAYDKMFASSAEFSRDCPCKKSFHDGAVPRYDFCGLNGTCVLSDPVHCGRHRAKCSSADQHNVTATFRFTQNTVANTFVSAYLRAGLLEESLKYMAVRRVLFKDRIADVGGLVVYGLAAAAGFATAENIEYVLEHDLLVTFGRMVLSIPGHCSTGLIIGIHLGYRKFLGKDCFPACLLSLPKVCLAAAFFLMTLAIPVLLHGTYDFVLMLPSYAPLSMPLRALIAMGTTALGFIYCRCAWMQMSNVCVVHVTDLQDAGRISRSRCCFCEADCCSAYCMQEDPLLHPEAVFCQPMAAGAAQEGDPSGLSRLTSIRHELLPQSPSCQTVEHRCPKCGNGIRLHVLYPSDCPFCGHSFPDFVRLSVLPAMVAEQAEAGDVPPSEVQRLLFSL